MQLIRGLNVSKARKHKSKQTKILNQLDQHQHFVETFLMT